jgi:putative polyketide hydroxylase
MDVVHVPVLIVGAGAAGLATSALLAKHGVHSLLVEKRREVFIYPKARNLSFRSLEILRGLGLQDEVHAVAEGISPMAVKRTLSSVDEEPVMDFDTIFAAFDGLSPEPSAQYCPQSRLEPILLAHTRKLGSEVRYGVELSSFGHDDTGVTAVVRDTESGQCQTVRADYLVAADGVHSPVRTKLAVPASGYGALPIYVVFAYFRAPWRQFVPHLGQGAAVQTKNPDVDGIFVAAEGDLGMFITTYLPSAGETAAQFTPQRCRELILAAVGEQIDVEIIEVAHWQPYERVADQFQCGRVFFVGDSAHTMPPFKAGGANTAIQSAHNLAWKLAAVLHGEAGKPLLATYHAERHPVGRFNAHQSLTGPPVAFLKLDDKLGDGDRPVLPAEEERPMFALVAGYQYRSTAVVDGPVSTDVDAVHLVEELRGQPGTRVPHACVRFGDRRVSTLDLLGTGFTLLTGDAGAPWQAAAAAVSSTMGLPISIGAITRARDSGGRWASLTNLRPDGALLIRPDDFVGWRVETLPERPEHELGHALSAILSRN